MSRLTQRLARRSRPAPAAPAPSDSQIARIDALTAAGRANWFLLLGYLAFVTITTLGVEDIDLFVDSRQTELPLVGVSIPTISFFIFAPVLGAALYAYLHLHIRKVTEALAETPSGDPPLEERIRPWLFNDYVLRKRADLAIRARPLDALAGLTTFLLIWLACPFVLGLMWARTFPAQEIGITSLAGIALLVVLHTGLQSYTKMRRDCGLQHLTSRRAGHVLTGLAAIVVLGLGTLATRGLVPPIVNPPIPFALIRPAVVSHADLSGATLADLPTDRRDHASAHLAYRGRWCDLRDLPEPACARLSRHDGLPAAPDLSAIRDCAASRTAAFCLSEMHHPSAEAFRRDWAAFRKAEIAALNRPRLAERRLAFADMDAVAITGGTLTRADLRSARMAFARMEDVDLRVADLRRAGLHAADLRGASMSVTQLDRATFRHAQLQGAELANVRGFRVNFGWADLSGAYLQEAALPEAILQRADISDAWAWGVDLQGGDLNGAVAHRAHLVHADLTGARLRGTDLTGANMAVADAVGADLTGATLMGTDLDRARLQNAKFEETTMQAVLVHDADLRGATDLTRARLDAMVGDDRTLLPDTPTEGGPAYVLDCLPRSAPGWEHLAPKLLDRADGDAAEAAALLDDILCRQGQQPQKTGTPWPLDRPPPWEEDPGWQPEPRGPADP